MKTSLSIDLYFQRIQFTDAPNTDFQALRELHKQHVLTIPFENLDIHLGKQISLEPGDLFQKIIIEKRGGYCFELNGLFQLLLESLGFQVFSAAARVLFDSDGIPPRSHRVLIVTVEGKDWLVDVGVWSFGLIEPIPLKTGVEHHQFGEKFKLEHDPQLGLLFQTEVKDIWISQYAFMLEPYLPVDFLFPNYYHSHSPESIFTQKKIVQLPTPEGRKKFVDMRLTIPIDGQITDRVATNDHEYFRMLKMHFNIVIPGKP